MGFRYGNASLAKIATLHPTLQSIAQRAIEVSPYDITIVHGWRGQEVQDALYACGASTKCWPDSMHNNTDDEGRPLSLALDFAPWVGGTIPWNETHIFACLAGCFFAVAKEHAVTLRWGGDWDRDGNTHEHKLQDWGHLEITLDWD